MLPAHNAARTLKQTLDDLSAEYIDELILVDDASSDDTHAMADELARSSSIPFTVRQLSTNRGYGGNQKECYRLALEHGATIVVMLHPDYQYDPKLVKHLVEFIREGYFDVMLGSRIRSRREALAGGMPLYKYLANRLLTFIENVASGRNLSEWHTGMRAYRREVLEHIPFEQFSDNFIFDQQALYAIIKQGYSIGDIPVPVRYFPEASSINLRHSIVYGLGTLWETTKFLAQYYRQLFVYGVSGFIGFATNMLVYALLLYQVGVWYLMAGVIAFCAGGLVSFVLQKYWTFGNRSSDMMKRQMTLYFLLALFNLAFDSLLLYGFVEIVEVHKLLANVLATLTVALWSYFLYKNVIFRPT